MPTWGEFAAERPDRADAGRQLLYQFGVGLAFLATTRLDGAPHRDGRYAMHSFPADDNEDAFSVAGRAAQVTDPAIVEALLGRYLEEREMTEQPAAFHTWEPFEFSLASCLLTRTTGHGDPAPRHTKWHAQNAG